MIRVITPVIRAHTPKNTDMVLIVSFLWIRDRMPTTIIPMPEMSQRTSRMTFFLSADVSLPKIMPP